MFRTKVTGRKVVNYFYLIAIILVLISNFFADDLSKLMLLTPKYEFSNRSEIHFIDVGQGDAVAIKMDNGKTMLIDTGTIQYQKKLSEYLDHIILNDSNKIDYLVLTHIDTDHSGNMMYILENYEIGTLYRPKIYSTFEDSTSINSSDWYDRIINLAIEKNIDMKFNEVGMKLIDGFNTFNWLSPIGINFNDEVASNEFSPVIKYEYKNNSALFTGDILEDTELDLLEAYPTEVLDIDILKVSHHGSAYSTCDEFIEATSPKFACISVGENTYGHPSNDTISRFLEYDNKFGTKLYSNLYTTLDNGNIIFTLSWDISVDTINNIDDYSFVSYYLYSTILLIVLIIFLTKPYYRALKKDIRFIIRNKNHEKLKQQEKQQ